MNVTKHFDSRMNQRGIRKRLIDLTFELGELNGDRVVLDLRAIDREVRDLQRRLENLAEARKKGGIVVITEDEALITTYRGVGAPHRDGWVMAQLPPQKPQLELLVSAATIPQRSYRGEVGDLPGQGALAA
jgi:hypothetical protein